MFTVLNVNTNQQFSAKDSNEALLLQTALGGFMNGWTINPDTSFMLLISKKNLEYLEEIKGKEILMDLFNTGTAEIIEAKGAYIVDEYGVALANLDNVLIDRIRDDREEAEADYKENYLLGRI